MRELAVRSKMEGNRSVPHPTPADAGATFFRQREKELPKLWETSQRRTTIEE